MHLDPAVTRLKYDREVSRLREQQGTLEKRGVFLLQLAEFPVVELLFVPRHPLRLMAPRAQSGPILLPQIAMAVIELPNLAARGFKARFNLSDYDVRPPSIEFRDPWTDSLLEYPTMFRALEYEKDRKAHVVLLGDHPATHKPFLCLRGVREYHEHPQHSGDDWFLYRGRITLFTLIMSLWRVSLDLVHAQLTLHPNGQLQTIWVAEEKL
jgi:hypothetical protein